METFYDALLDAVLDCLKVMPILFLAYLLVSYLSHDHNHKFSGFLSKKKKTSVMYAAFLGCIPQCGFSSVISDLYSKQRVTLGTLIAVFIATSDEAIPIMIATPNKILDMLLLIGIKIILALFWGYLIDFIVDVIKKAKLRNQKKDAVTLACAFASEGGQRTVVESVSHTHDVHEEHSHHHKHHECGHIHTDECGAKCHHEKECCVDNIFLDAFMHMFEIAIYIFIATFIINLLVYNFTADILTSILTNNVYIQILIACFVGLIPNCASSVLLVEIYMMGGGALYFPALVAGLSTGAGVGLFILASRNRKHPLQTIGIIVLQFCLGVISGIALSFIPPLMTM